MIRYYDFDLTDRLFGERVLFRRVNNLSHGVCIYSESEMYSNNTECDNFWDREWRGLPVFVEITPKCGEIWERSSDGVKGEVKGVVNEIVSWHCKEEECQEIKIVEFLLNFKNKKMKELEEDRINRELFGGY